eukprot:g1124.t1
MGNTSPSKSLECAEKLESRTRHDFSQTQGKTTFYKHSITKTKNSNVLTVNEEEVPTIFVGRLGVRPHSRVKRIEAPPSDVEDEGYFPFPETRASRKRKRLHATDEGNKGTTYTKKSAAAPYRDALLKSSSLTSCKNTTSYHLRSKKHTTRSLANPKKHQQLSDFRMKKRKIHSNKYSQRRSQRHFQRHSQGHSQRHSAARFQDKQKLHSRARSHPVSRVAPSVAPSVAPNTKKVKNIPSSNLPRNHEDQDVCYNEDDDADYATDESFYEAMEDENVSAGEDTDNVVLQFEIGASLYDKSISRSRLSLKLSLDSSSVPTCVLPGFRRVAELKKLRDLDSRKVTEVIGEGFGEHIMTVKKIRKERLSRLRSKGRQYQNVLC